MAVIDPDARLVPDGLGAALEVIERESDVQAVLTAERSLPQTGLRVEELVRASWSQIEARAWAIGSGLVVLRRSFVEALGGLRPDAGWDGAHDLLLRASADARVAVVSDIGCLRDGPLGPARPRRSIASVLVADLERRDVDGWIEGSRVAPGAYRARRRLDSHPTVSVIIPTRDHPDLVEMVLDGLARTRWRPLEVVLVDNGTTDARALTLMERSAHRVIRVDIPFNYSRLVNRGAAAARGEILLILNNDIEVREPDWIEAMVEQALDPDVGPVGALLCYPLGSIQHCGVSIGPHGPQHTLVGLARNEVPSNLVEVPRQCTAVDGACLAIRADVFRRLGGMETLIATNYGDVDLCLRATQIGLRSVFTPYAELIHHEGATRGREASPDIVADWLLFRSRWADVLERVDPWWPAGVDLDTGLPRAA